VNKEERYYSIFQKTIFINKEKVYMLKINVLDKGYVRLVDTLGNDLFANAFPKVFVSKDRNVI
jgi:hypothetical protein